MSQVERQRKESSDLGQSSDRGSDLSRVERREAIRGSLSVSFDSNDLSQGSDRRCPCLLTPSDRSRATEEAIRVNDESSGGEKSRAI